jgi:hypothetical protein
VEADRTTSKHLVVLHLLMVLAIAGLIIGYIVDKA